MRSESTHFNSKVALNNDNNRTENTKLFINIARNYFQDSFQTEFIKVVGKSPTVDLNKGAHLSFLHITWENRVCQPKKSTTTLFFKLRKISSSWGHWYPTRGYHPQLIVVSTVCMDIHQHAPGRSQSLRKLAKAYVKILYHAVRKHLIVRRNSALGGGINKNSI